MNRVSSTKRFVTKRKANAAQNFRQMVIKSKRKEELDTSDHFYASEYDGLADTAANEVIEASNSEADDSWKHGRRIVELGKS